MGENLISKCEIESLIPTLISTVNYFNFIVFLCYLFVICMIVAYYVEIYGPHT